MTAYAERKRDEHNAAIQIAWLGAMFKRAEKFPNIEDFLLKDERHAVAEMTAEQKDARIAANLRALRKRFEK
ncbi:hypothetical protein [Paracoccus sulfuroxidans]|uniref:hypothetical protein n=1 Tax=Paracoccus sulfuroxidans TaxID=384678 RepID=UPI00119F166D|nr:hypothetical protein [Paracoccus sulfuroxidans]